MGNPQLAVPSFTVVMDDGAVLDVQGTNLDMLRTERHARERGWPSMQDAAIEWATYMAWVALRREGAIPGELTYDGFTERAVSIESRLGRGVDPTPAAPGDE